ncbi:MAG: pyruvate dehydrogenase complex E1 component subunit beta [Armatimonadetes bacterium]|nr:pyruvate dehydrogenase complex E1 component subunit beta [Armatimonadota bacterium]
MAVITYRRAISQALQEEMDRDPDVFLMGEEIGVYEGIFQVTHGLLAKYGPERVVDTPIAEEGFVGVAIGAAMLGLRPVVEMMTHNFGMLAIDQVVNHAAKYLYMSGGQFPIPMVIRGPGGPGVQLAAQHSQSLEAWYAHVPGLKVVLPYTAADAKGLLKSAIRDDNPVFYMEHGSLYATKGDVPSGEHLTPIGKANILRPGKDVTLVSYSWLTGLALRAAETLERDGIDCEVVDLRSLKPLDSETALESVRKTRRAVTVEETWKAYGVGAEIAARIYEGAFDLLAAPVERIAAEDVPLPYNRNLELAAIPNEAKVVSGVRKAMRGAKAPVLEEARETAGKPGS